MWYVSSTLLFDGGQCRTVPSVSVCFMFLVTKNKTIGSTSNKNLVTMLILNMERGFVLSNHGYLHWRIYYKKREYWCFNSTFNSVLIALLERLSSPRFLVGIVLLDLEFFCVMFCRSLFVLFFWPLYCLSLLDLRLLITPVVSSNCSY